MAEIERGEYVSLEELKRDIAKNKWTECKIANSVKKLSILVPEIEKFYIDKTQTFW
jgi:hypothetical protein